MRQSIKLVIKKSGARKDGLSLIFLQYCHSSKRRVLVGTDIAIPSIYWNKKREGSLKTFPHGMAQPKNWKPG